MAVARTLRARVRARVKARWMLKQLLGPSAPLLVAMLVIATALLLTASRGGTLSTLFGLVMLMLADAVDGAGVDDDLVQPVGHFAQMRP